MKETVEFQQKAINTIRFLSADGVQQAKSGHPGLPMGAAAMAYTIWTRHLKHNPGDPKWADRDRFILSGGHGSMLLYSLLHLTGYDLSLDELKHFRQWGSKTPGHPEYGLTPGVDTTTGPLGQGFANGVGMAMAERHLASQFNKPKLQIVDHFVYAIVTDGDLMEGVTSEAASLAGTLKLGKLIYLYDDNHISIEGSTELAFTEDRAARFKAYGWHVQTVANGNDVEAIDKAIRSAKKDPRPSLICCRTTIGFGLPTREGTSKAHGEPPGDDELNGAKVKLGWPVEPRFYIPEDVLEFYRAARKQGVKAQKAWSKKMAVYAAAYPDLAAEFTRRMEGNLPEGWDRNLPEFAADPKGMATRSASGKVLNALAERLPELVGGSADLAPSTNTWMSLSGAFSNQTPEGRNIHFGVREHAMGSIVNGMAYHGGLLPFGATFLVFSDYMRGALRVAAISHLHTTWVFTHDSIGVGEDGPTHQPIEHLAALRAIPNMVVIRPGDANEVREAWKAAMENAHGPVALIFSRQNMPTMDRSEMAPAANTAKGAYVLADLGKGKPEVILMASGSEVYLIVEAGKKLAEEGVAVRLVSFPSWELFEAQDEAYRQSVLPADLTRRVSIEAGVTMGWEKYASKVIGLNHYGASAPYQTVYNNFGLTAEAVVEAVHQMGLGK